MKKSLLPTIKHISSCHHFQHIQRLFIIQHIFTETYHIPEMCQVLGIQRLIENLFSRSFQTDNGGISKSAVRVSTGVKEPDRDS